MSGSEVRQEVAGWIPLTEASDVDTAGGKASALATALANGHRVPDGVVKATVTAKGREPQEIDLTGARDGDEIEVLLRRKE